MTKAEAEAYVAAMPTYDVFQGEEMVELCPGRPVERDVAVILLMEFGLKSGIPEWALKYNEGMVRAAAVRMASTGESLEAAIGQCLDFAVPHGPVA